MTSIPYDYVKNLKNFTFNGQGHAIMNLSIDQSGTSEIGLFGQVEESSIINVRLVNAYVNGNNNAGGIVGRAINSIIKDNAVVDSYVEGRDHVGSVAGEVRGNAGCEFTNNYSNSEVYSREYQAGGMIGTTLGAVIEHNLFIGKVTCGRTNGAGLVALVDGTESETIIKNNAVFATSVDAPNAYALTFTAGRPCAFQNNYSLDKCLYNGGYFGLTNPDDQNGGQVDWATATSRAFYSDVLGFDLAQTWTFNYGGLYPTPSYIVYDGPTKAKVPVTTAGYATFVAPADVDFSQAQGVEAFYVTDGGSAHKKLEPATLVRHGEAVVVKAQVEESGEPALTGVEVQDEVNLVLTNGDVKLGTKTVTITCADLGFENSEKVSAIEFEGGQITLSKGEGTVVPTYYTSGSALRTYGSNVITFTGKDQAIAKVVLHCVSSGYTGTSWAVTAQDNTLELLNTGTKQIRIVSMDITFADEGITVPYTAQEIAEPYAANELKAATDFIDADGSQYVLAEKDGVVGFYQATEGSIINKGKGYLEVAAPAVKVFYLTTGDETGIAETMTDEVLKADGAIYDLSGRRVEKLQKGIYIVNGKKVVNK
jgi:catechol 2,3-dioxygenase-like lactoylglutathione lyase family enzyme